MATVCIKKNCNNESHENGRYCILHCDKKEFSSQNVLTFWQKIRNEYVTYDIYKNITELVDIKGIKFPSFELVNRNYYDNNFFKARRNSLEQHLLFENCMFTDDFNLNMASVKHLTFKNCIFHENIKNFSVENLEIINSEFKNEITFENVVCNELIISENTEFKKNVTFKVKDTLELINSVFKNNFTLIGNNNLQSIIEKSQFNKSIEISKTSVTHFNNVKINGTLSFTTENNHIHLENTTFTKNIVFGDFISIVTLNKVNISSDIKLINVNSLEIKNNSKLDGNLILEDISEKFILQDSKVAKKLDTTNIKDIVINSSILENKFQNYFSTNNFTIKNSTVKDLELCTTNTLNLIDTHLEGTVNLFGDSYQNVSIKNCKCNKEISINNVANNLSISKLLNYPLLKLSMDCKSIILDNSRISSFTINKAKNLLISKCIIKKDFIIETDDNLTIRLDNTKFNKQCNFPSINTLTIQNKCIFSEEITFKKIQTGNFKNSFFNEVVRYNGTLNHVNFELCSFKKDVYFTSSVKLDIFNSTFDEELNFFEATLHDVLLRNVITKNLNFQKTVINHITFESDGYDEEYKTVVNGNIDFSYAQIDNIKINNSCFKGQLIFNQITNTLDLNKINNVDFKDKLLINQSQIDNLFLDAKNITINNLDISNSSLTAQNGAITKKALTIKDIKINTFKLKEVNFIDDVNFQNLEIEKLLFTNSNIEKVFRIKNCFIQTIESQDNIFEDLQLIDNQYTKHKDIKRNISFQNTTIKNAVFDKLKFDEFKMNDAHVSSAKIGYVEFEKASRETNRFFKNYYDSISDFVTANKYYAKEMLEQLKVLKGLDKFIFHLNKWFSDFGQSWVRPLIWMFITTLICYRLANFDLLSVDGFRENHIRWMLNDILKFSNPFSKTSTTNYGTMYWAWFVHKLFISALMYHFVVAIKRRTKR